jgi:MFS superfamily sulfate permease-like transporter
VTIVASSSGLITARAFGHQIGARTDAKREIAGFGVANVVAALSQGLVITASDSRTALAAASGARSALVGLVSSITVALVSLFLAAPISLLPHAALAAILASSAVDLIDLPAFRQLARISRDELVLALIATAGVLWLGVLNGVIVAVAATLANLIMMVARPRDGVMGRAPGSGDLVTLRRDPKARHSEGILVYLFEASLFFVNADYFADRLHLALRARPRVGWLVLDTSSMIYLDSSGVEALERIEKELGDKGIRLLVGGGHGRFRDVLFRSGLADRIGKTRIFTTAEGAMAAAEAMRDGAAREPGQAGPRERQPADAVE